MPFTNRLFVADAAIFTTHKYVRNRLSAHSFFFLLLSYSLLTFKKCKKNTPKWM